MSAADPATAFERLKIETAEMLHLNAAGLSLVENLQLDLISLLRLEVDGLQGLVLAGDAVDLNRLATALGMLQKLLPAQALVAAAPDGRDDFADAHAELNRFLVARAERIEAHASKLRDEVQAREEMAAIAAASLEPDAPKAPAPALPLDLPRSDNVVPLSGVDRANMALPPLHYLKQAKEPWE